MAQALDVDVREPPGGQGAQDAAAAVPKGPATAGGTPGIPTRIGRFVIREEIGRGSNGVVYSATDPVLGREVAIKAIPLAQDPGQADAETGFLQEAKIAAGLNHPSIVTIFDAGKTEFIAYMAMERLKGMDLHHWLANNRTMAAEHAAALMARVADAVHFAHRRGLIHRDIKPSNIFLGRDMKPKVLDFGIALAQGQQVRPDEPRKLIGTPNYMSPEQAVGRPLDARSDIFSLGAILYEMITGHRAFDGADIDEILTKVVKVDPPLLSSWRPEVSPIMSEIVFRALAKDPSARYQTAGQLRNDLAAFAGRPVAPPTSPPGGLAAPVPPRAAAPIPAPGAIAVIGVAVVAFTLTFAYWYWSHHDEVPSQPPEPAIAAPAQPAQTEPTPPAAAAAVPPAAAEAEPAEAAPPAPLVHAAQPKAARRAVGRSRAAAPEPLPAPPPPVQPGTLALAIVPWGEVFVDGVSAGVAPPLNHLTLPAGKHTVEVHNGGFRPFVAQVDIAPGQTFTLQHGF